MKKFVGFFRFVRFVYLIELLLLLLLFILPEEGQVGATRLVKGIGGFVIGLVGTVYFAREKHKLYLPLHILLLVAASLLFLIAII